MDKLKDFIEANRESFDDEQVPEGHLERFEKKQETHKRSLRSKRYSLFAFVAAACIALLFLLRLPGGTPITPQKNISHQPHKCAIKEEFEELRLYYNMQMDNVISQMQELYKQEQIPGAEGLITETKRVLTDNYLFEETVLPTLPCSNDGLSAMNQHYSSSLESLHIMLLQMEKMDKIEMKHIE